MLSFLCLLCFACLVCFTRLAGFALLGLIALLSVFFSSVKIKSVRETFFLPFLLFFHGQKIAFTHTFLQVFTGVPNFSRALLRIFSRMVFYFHVEDFLEIFTYGFLFCTG